jgi:TatD DNase family protein
LIPDSHAHLDLVERDTGDVVADARSSGVRPIITIGITIDSSIEAMRTASSFEEVFASVGIHPNDTAGATPEQFERLEELARSSDRVVAIGETGLDYYRDRTPADIQKRALRKHIKLARKLGKALIIHDRQAHHDVLEILAEEGAGETAVIMHCFSGNEEVLADCVRRGYYISFAGPLTFKKSDETRRMASLAPLDRLLVETDSPFLSPHPFRGKPNIPERARLVADALAGARGVPLEEMECVLAENTARAFGITIPEG